MNQASRSDSPQMCLAARASPSTVADPGRLENYFVEECYAEAWVVDSRAEVSHRGEKSFYLNHPDALKKYRAVSGIVIMHFSYDYTPHSLYFDVREGIIGSHLIGYNIVHGVDHRDLGIDEHLGVGENFMKFFAEFRHSQLYLAMVPPGPDQFEDEHLLGVIRKHFGERENPSWSVFLE
ncbi:hypothetical protein BGX27_003485 [Mortierella sp. AM989]|nr:hypothetical protein BGX27_003485 [Mortierella sp. AM989]